MNRQYVAIKFRMNDRRSYTYHNDGERMMRGDRVKVPDRSGNGWSAGQVVDVHYAKPAFPTRALLGKIAEEPAAQGDLLAGEGAA